MLLWGKFQQLSNKRLQFHIYEFTFISFQILPRINHNNWWIEEYLKLVSPVFCTHLLIPNAVIFYAVLLPEIIKQQFRLRMVTGHPDGTGVCSKDLLEHLLYWVFKCFPFEQTLLSAFLRHDNLMKPILGSRKATGFFWQGSQRTNYECTKNKRNLNLIWESYKLVKNRNPRSSFCLVFYFFFF